MIPKIGIFSLLIFLINTLSSLAQGLTNGLSFDGVNDFIRLDTYSLVRPHADHTIEMWVKSDATETGAIYGESFLFSNFRGQFRLAGNGSGKLVFFYRPASSILVNNVTSTTDVFDGTWHHIAFVGNGNTTTLYVDGIADATNFSYVRPASSEQTALKIGAQSRCCFASGGFDQPFGGQIDEVRLWSTNRSATQIRDNMCQKLVGDEANLEIYYPLNQTSGTTVTDLSTATVRDGTISHPNLTAPYADWSLSGAPVGDESINSYSVNLSTSLNIEAAAGDNLTANVTAIGTIPGSIHMYRVDNAPENATPPGTQTRLSETTYYGVKVFGGTGVVYTVVYDYDGHIGIVNESTLELAARDDNEDVTWTQETATLNTTTNTLTLTGQTGTEFILGDVGVINPLPIELISFEATLTPQNTIEVTWQTAFEINNDHFTIERSVNGTQWEVINKTRGHGNSSVPVSYSYIDKHPYSGLSYYRLKQTDFDGQYTYSAVKSVNITKGSSDHHILTYPNPFLNEITIEGNPVELQQIEVYNLSGQNVTALTKIIRDNQTKLILDLSNLSKGVYLLKTRTTTSMMFKQ